METWGIPPHLAGIWQVNSMCGSNRGLIHPVPGTELMGTIWCENLAWPCLYQWENIPAESDVILPQQLTSSLSFEHRAYDLVSLSHRLRATLWVTLWPPCWRVLSCFPARPFLPSFLFHWAVNSFSSLYSTAYYTLCQVLSESTCYEGCITCIEPGKGQAKAPQATCYTFMQALESQDRCLARL